MTTSVIMVTDDQRIASIRAYIDKHFSGLSSEKIITDAELIALVWVEKNAFNTQSVAVNADTAENLQWETKRILARVNAAYLLRKGDTESYEKFTIGQELTNKLAKSSFDELARKIKSLSAEDFKALIAVQFVVKGPEADGRFLEKAGKAADKDGVIAQADYIRLYPNIFPHIESFLTTHQADFSNNQKAYGDWLFFAIAHPRWMLWAENDAQTLYEPFLQKLETKEFDQRAMQLWYANTVVNLAGFEGNMKPLGETQKEIGASFFTQPLYVMWDILQDILGKVKSGKLPKDANKIAEEYYANMANKFNIPPASQSVLPSPMVHISEAQRLTLTRIALLLWMKIKNNDFGTKLWEAFVKLKAEDKTAIIKAFYPLTLTGTEKQQGRYTYLPAILGNAYAISKNMDVTLRVITLCAKVISEHEKVLQNKPTINPTLSFNPVSAPKIIGKILEDIGKGNSGNLQLLEGNIQYVEAGALNKAPAP